MVKREYGKEQPYVSLGIFKLRLPFIHYRIEIPEALQGFILVAVALGAISVHQEALGVSFEAASIMVAINGVLYLLHPGLGDPVFPGWITPAIPLVLSYLKPFEGVDKIHATIALQLLMAALFLFMGITGLAKKIVSIVPLSMRAGIIMGAGISATYSVVRPGGRIDNAVVLRDAGGAVTGYQHMWISFLIGAFICLLILYSVRFSRAKEKNALLKLLSKYGMLPGLLAALIIGVLIKELPSPVFSGKPFIDLARYSFTPEGAAGRSVIDATIFRVGFPPIQYFLQALPMMVTCYIIAFGDFVLAEVVTKEADVVRQDESIDFNPNRSNLISGVRNAILGVVAPYAPLSGPLWAAGTIATAERYKQGREGMDSIFGGHNSYVIAMAIAGFFLPIVELLKPVLPLALSLTLIVQGFACGYIAIDMCKTREERGVAAIVAIFIAFQQAWMGLAAGILLHIVIGTLDARPFSEWFGGKKEIVSK